MAARTSSPACWRRTSSRSRSSMTSTVLPAGTMAPDSPMGTTSLTLGTESSARRMAAKSSSCARSRLSIWNPPMTANSSADFEL